MSEPLLASSFLFRFSVECRHIDKPWSAKEPELPEEFAIPCFNELDDREPFANVRMGWHETGLAVSVRVQGKKQQPWCRASKVDDSDGLRIFIDTRNTQTIHRASRFCHQFVFMPQGRGPKFDQPHGVLGPIKRAKENPKRIREDQIRLRSEKRIDGYLLRAMISSDAMTGYDTPQFTELGFSYAVVDRELGWQTFSVGPEYPFPSEPSLWGTLQLAPE